MDYCLYAGHPVDQHQCGARSERQLTINATDELLYVCVGGTGDNCQGGTKAPIFSTLYEGYFWDVDNFGLRNAQIRLYAQ